MMIAGNLLGFFGGERMRVSKVLLGVGYFDLITKPKETGGTGFRDTTLFIQALLARQTWRLIQYPQSLAARPMKAIYYLRGNLSDAVFGNEGIEHGLEQLKKRHLESGIWHYIMEWREYIQFKVEPAWHQS